MMRKTKIQPIASHCLIEKVKEIETKTDSGIIIPTETDENFSEGIILALGNKLIEDKNLFDKDLNIGAKVLYNARNIIYEDKTENIILIPYNAIVAILDNNIKVTDDVDNFFNLGDWETFKGKKSEIWIDYLNIKTFSINSKFLTPFANLEPLHKLSHEIIFETAKKAPDLNLHSVESRIVGEDNNKSFITVISDDMYGCGYTLGIKDEGLNFEFKKIGTDIRTICETVPLMLGAYSNIMKSNLFKRYVEPDFSKAKRLVMSIEQEIRLNWQGLQKKPIKNSEAMQQFLKLKSTEEDRKNKALLEALSFNPETIGRIDLTLSFDKEIDGNEYTIFLSLNAPANDKNSLINATWTIVNENPGIIYEHDLGRVFSEFFKSTVLQGFYHRWFKENMEIDVSTLKK